MRFGLEDYFKSGAVIALYLVRSFDLVCQIMHKLQSQSFGSSHFHIIGKSNVIILNNHGVPVQFVIQMDLDFARFTIGKGMLEGIRVLLFINQAGGLKRGTGIDAPDVQDNHPRNHEDYSPCDDKGINCEKNGI